MKVHHIGYAVEDILAASKTFAAMGFSILSGICRDNDRNVDIMLLRNGATTIELVAPTTVGSPIDKVLESCGPCCYHICYQVENLEAGRKQLTELHFKAITDMAPAPALGKEDVVFMFNKDVGLIELVGPKSSFPA